MTIPYPLPITAISSEFCRNLRYFLMDIDDTLTTQGRITASAFQAMWNLHDAGIIVIPITGRPAGWCDHIARMWPVDAVIGENGAFCFAYDRSRHRMIRHQFQDESDRIEGIRRLEIMKNRVIREVPGCAISADQSYRISDLAVDFCEDVNPLPPDSVDAICAIARELGLTFKISSIHVNCWFGDFNKLLSLEKLLPIRYGFALKDLQKSLVFIGDSPNDEPIFAAVEQSIAVSNISRFLKTLHNLPTYITRDASGAGFREAVDLILERRHPLATV